MPDRDMAIATFLKDVGWGDATVAPLAGDASNRRYLRLTCNEAQPGAVLMDAPAEKGEDVRPFIQIATWLHKAGFSAPAVLAQDVTQGFLLLEDLGDALFARVVQDQPALEHRLYSGATDVLIDLHAITPPDHLAAYSIDVMTDMAALSYDWYLASTIGPNDASKAAFMPLMSKLLQDFAPQQDVLIQRDYHSENLLWLPERHGIAQVGLLDFQDAMLGHRAYDLVSLLQDARRDVPPQIERQMIELYADQTEQDQEEFDAAYNVLGAQRNLRILGVFARLCVRDGKTHYVDLIPRVWGLLQRDLSHPALAELASTVNTDLPAPNATLLQKLKDICATAPSL